MKCIIHLDMDCFYAQVEAVRLGAEAKGKPIGIRQKGLLVTCDYEARARGLRKCMPLQEALRLCPELLVVPGEDVTPYRRVSDRITAVLSTLGCPTERLGFDENFIDVTQLAIKQIENFSKTIGNKSCNCPPEAHSIIAAGAKIAQQARDLILKETGLTCSAGIAHNKTLAKLVGVLQKPNQQTCIFPCEAASYIISLESLKSIPGVGTKCLSTLNTLQINNALQLLTKPLSELERVLGKDLARKLRDLANGKDDSPVLTSGRPPNIGVEESFEPSDPNQVETRIPDLLDRLLILVEEDGRRPSGASVTSRGTDGKRKTKRIDITPSSLRSKEDLIKIFVNLWKKVRKDNISSHLTLIGIAFNKMSE